MPDESIAKSPADTPKKSTETLGQERKAQKDLGHGRPNGTATGGIAASEGPFKVEREEVEKTVAVYAVVWPDGAADEMGEVDQVDAEEYAGALNAAYAAGAAKAEEARLVGVAEGRQEMRDRYAASRDGELAAEGEARRLLRELVQAWDACDEFADDPSDSALMDKALSAANSYLATAPIPEDKPTGTIFDLDLFRERLERRANVVEASTAVNTAEPYGEVQVGKFLAKELREIATDLKTLIDNCHKEYIPPMTDEQLRENMAAAERFAGVKFPTTRRDEA